MLGFIKNIIHKKCGEPESFCNMFAGTGVVGSEFNSAETKVISNDILRSNYFPLKTFLASVNVNLEKLGRKIEFLNSLETNQDNYFSIHFGNRYFTVKNARKIGLIRQEIEDMKADGEIKDILITSLLYAIDKVANTVGHYDAFRKKIDAVGDVKLLMPEIRQENNRNNEVYCEDANSLIRKIKCDVLYLDPPYNSRQYCDAYHLLENLATWEKPQVFGKAKKMERGHIKSKYCLKEAPEAFADLIKNAHCNHILVSYNNTGDSKDSRSNARIMDSDIIDTLANKGEVKIFHTPYKAFTAGKCSTEGHVERIFYCRVN